MNNNNKKGQVSPISRRLIIYVTLFSVLISIITTLFQGYRQYQNEIAVVRSEFSEIQQTHQDTLSGSLWILNKVQIDVELQGIVHLPDIDYVAITKNHKVLYSAGEKPNKRNPLRFSIPLEHEYNGKLVHLGTLHAYSSLQSVYTRLIKSLWAIFIVTSIEIFSIAFMISYLFKRLVSRHLFDISAYTRSINLHTGKNKSKLTLSRRKNGHDELDDVVDSLNYMYESATSAMAESEYKQHAFEDYVRASSDWYWQTDANFRFNEISPNFKKFTGEDPVNYLGKTRWEMAGVRQLTGKWAEHVKILESHKPFDRFEYTRVMGDGKIRHLQVSGVPIFSESGKFEGYRGTVKDISDVKNLEKQLIHSQKLDAVGRLAGGIAHDYNNMLNVILGNIELLECTANLEEKDKEYLNSARGAALRSVGLTRKLLGFARNSSQDFIPISVNDVIGGLEVLISKSLTAAIEIKTRLASDIWIVEIDPAELEDCLINLAINARDAMPNGGILTLSSENKYLSEDDVVDIKDAKPGDYVMVSASDTGSGMPADVMQHVFEPFYTTKVKGKGTGLGLSMVFNFAQHSGGFVTVSSEQGKGSTFSIYLPRYSEIQLQPADSIRVAEPVDLPSGTESILVVEDEEALRELVKEQLNALGYKVYVADCAANAMEIINDGTEIDLLFCDMILPGDLDGFQLCLEVSKTWPGLKLLMVSGYADPETLKSYEDNADIGTAVRNMLYKPYTVAELANAIRSCIAGT